MKPENHYSAPRGIAATVNRHLAAGAIHPVRYAVAHLDLVTIRRLGNRAFDAIRNIVARPNITRAEIIEELRAGSAIAPIFQGAGNPQEAAFACAIAEWLRFTQSGGRVLTLTAALELQLEHTVLAQSIQAGDARSDEGVSYYIEFGPDRLYPDPLVVNDRQFVSEGAYISQSVVRSPFPADLRAQIRYFGGTTQASVRVVDVLLTGGPIGKDALDDAVKPITLVMPDESVNLEEWVSKSVAWHEANSELWRQGAEPRRPHAQLQDVQRIVHALKAVIIGRLAGSNGAVPAAYTAPDQPFAVLQPIRMVCTHIFPQVHLGEPRLEAVIEPAKTLPARSGNVAVGMHGGRLAAIQQSDDVRRLVWDAPTFGYRDSPAADVH